MSDGKANPKSVKKWKKAISKIKEAKKSLKNLEEMKKKLSKSQMGSIETVLLDSDGSEKVTGIQGTVFYFLHRLTVFRKSYRIC